MDDLVDPPRFVLVFGSYVRCPRDARDIDIFYSGMSCKDAEDIVRHAYPEDCARIPIDATEIPSYDFNPRQTLDLITEEWRISPGPFISVPVPCDSPNTQYKFLYASDSTPEVVVTRYDTTVASILREGAGWGKALERLENTEVMELNIEETSDQGLWPRTELHNIYSNGRLSTQKAALDHFGLENLTLLCDKLWWGKLLQRFVEEQPNMTFVDQVRNWSSGWSGRLLFRRDGHRVWTSHGSRVNGWTCEECEDRMFDAADPYRLQGDDKDRACRGE